MNKYVTDLDDWNVMHMQTWFDVGYYPNYDQNSSQNQFLPIVLIISFFSMHWIILFSQLLILQMSFAVFA